MLIRRGAIAALRVVLALALVTWVTASAQPRRAARIVAAEEGEIVQGPNELTRLPTRSVRCGQQALSDRPALRACRSVGDI